MERYYPGAQYVDVLALDGYNWGSTTPEYGGWQSFEQVFERAYERLTALGDQPIWIAEVGSAPEGGDKADWVRNMFETAARWDRLKAIVWFDLNKEQDWPRRRGPPARASRRFSGYPRSRCSGATASPALLRRRRRSRTGDAARRRRRAARPRHRDRG